MACNNGKTGVAGGAGGPCSITAGGLSRSGAVAAGGLLWCRIIARGARVFVAQLRAHGRREVDATS